MEELKVYIHISELFHGHGLGILAVGPEYPATLNLLLKSKENAQKIRDFFYLLGRDLNLSKIKIDSCRNYWNMNRAEVGD